MFRLDALLADRVVLAASLRALIIASLVSDREVLTALSALEQCSCLTTVPDIDMASWVA